MINAETLSPALSHHWNRVSFSKFQNNLSPARIHTSAGEGRGAAQDVPVWSQSQRELPAPKENKTCGCCLCGRVSSILKLPDPGGSRGPPKSARVWV